MYYCSRERIKDKIYTFSQYGAEENGGITRFALSKEDLQARNEFVKRMKAINALIETDDMGNIYATLQGSCPELKKIVMGSHCDSVRCGGNYDGILGVIAAMEVLETVALNNIPHKHGLTAMIWTNEEGSCYLPSMMSSGVVCGKYLPKEIAAKFKHEDMLKSMSADGIKDFETALNESGFKGSANNRLNPDDYRAMYELHIEQGPVLEAENKEIGVVECVIGSVIYNIKITGQSNHAGTTPMKYRKDALFAFSKVLNYIHDELDKIDDNLVYTTGEIKCHPNIHTVIPDIVEFTLDARHENPLILEKVGKVIENMPKEFEKCIVEADTAWTRKTVYFDKTLVNYAAEAVNELGYSNRRMNSGAGHDAQFASYMLPTAMIFVPSKDGRSHCSQEYTPDEICAKGVDVLLNAVIKCDNE